MNKKLFLFSILIFLYIGVVMAGSASVSIIPEPAECQIKPGFFELTAETRIVADEPLRPIAELWSKSLGAAAGLEPEIIQTPSGQKGIIHLHINPDLKDLGKEGYLLQVTEEAVRVQAFGEAGIFYGLVSLRQLLGAEIFSQSRVENIRWTIPCLQIRDRPRFGWRGMHLDVSRHFMPVEFVKKYIDLIALHKMNVFHWHLTDDQGWRIEIKKYPKLTEVGAWRKETLVGLMSRQPREFDGTPHGGFYTQEEIREIVEYARRRFVTVVPEIDMPGHMQAAIAAYPELGTTGRPTEVLTYWGGCEQILNVEESTVRFMQDVLAEVLDLFPSEFIHIGGDEVNKQPWKDSPRTQARMKELGLANEEQLQSWFIKQMDTFLAERGRRLIGWDEILEGGLAPGATVMSWRGMDGGIAAATAGHDVVMAPSSHTYFDYYQGDPNTEPLAIGGFIPLEKVYAFEPVPEGLSQSQARHILGAQGQVWTEYISTPGQVEYLILPRMCALAEVIWSPREKTDFEKFQCRLETHLKRLEYLDVNFRRPEKKR
jgi:hexosaminidase